MIVLHHTSLPEHVHRRGRELREHCSEEHVQRYTEAALRHTRAIPLENGAVAYLQPAEVLGPDVGRYR